MFTVLQIFCEVKIHTTVAQKNFTLVNNTHSHAVESTNSPVAGSFKKYWYNSMSLRILFRNRSFNDRKAIFPRWLFFAKQERMLTCKQFWFLGSRLTVKQFRYPSPYGEFYNIGQNPSLITCMKIPLICVFISLQTFYLPNHVPGVSCLFDIWKAAKKPARCEAKNPWERGCYLPTVKQLTTRV